MEVAEVLPEFADAFAFEEFNRMQREAVPALLESEDNVVASAPTAAGKTALAELAICKALADGGTALFIAPMRALTNEKEDDWDPASPCIVSCRTRSSASPSVAPASEARSRRTSARSASVPTAPAYQMRWPSTSLGTSQPSR